MRLRAAQQRTKKWAGDRGLLDTADASKQALYVAAEAGELVQAMLKGKRGANRDIRATNYDQLDLVPADFRYRRIDTVLGGLKRPKKRLRRLVDPQRDRYDFQWIDCAPNISLVSESVFSAADALLIPMIPTTLSMRPLKQVRDFTSRKGYDLPLLPFFTMADHRKRHHRDVIESLPRSFPNVLETVIPYASDVERMGVERAPVMDFAPRSKAASAYQALWDEIRARVE